MSFKYIVLIASSLALQSVALTSPAFAQAPAPAALTARPGWVNAATPHNYAALVARVEEVVKANKMAVVNAASASDGAKAQGFTIPGNRVMGVYRNDFARRMLAASIPAGIEAPIRIYVTESADGKTTLSYVKPSTVFAPYFSDAGADLKKVAEELDVIFAKIHMEAIAP
jgi:uncharacterized protein (DUF302 family)